MINEGPWLCLGLVLVGNLAASILAPKLWPRAPIPCAWLAVISSALYVLWAIATMLLMARGVMIRLWPWLD
jgi:hypothetical protein